MIGECDQQIQLNAFGKETAAGFDCEALPCAGRAGLDGDHVESRLWRVRRQLWMRCCDCDDSDLQKEYNEGAN